MTAPLRAVPPPDPGHVKRRQALDHFAAIAGLPAIERIVQRGREADATYTMHLADGCEVRIGTIKVLWSQSELSKVLAVAIGRSLPADLSNSDWATIRTRLIDCAIEIDEAPGETFADTVRDWLGGYCEKAGTDRDGAMTARRPYIDADDICVHAVSFARDIRRQYSASVKEKELVQALADLGFVRRTIMYNRGSKRTSASYYVAPLDVLDPGDTLIEAGK